MATWYKLSSFDENEERAKKILDRFGVVGYHFVTINGLKALAININLNSYRIEVDTYNELLLVRKKKYDSRARHQPEGYKEIVKSFKNDAIYASIKFCAEDSGIYRT